MSVRVRAVRILASVFFAMTIVAMGSMFSLSNVGSIYETGLEGWVTFLFLTMVGSFLALMVTVSVAADAFSAQK